MKIELKCSLSVDEDDLSKKGGKKSKRAAKKKIFTLPSLLVHIAVVVSIQAFYASFVDGFCRHNEACISDTDQSNRCHITYV